jgi:hypothetical protein
LLSLSASAVLRLRAVCDQRMRREVQYLSGRWMPLEGHRLLS